MKKNKAIEKKVPAKKSVWASSELLDCLDRGKDCFKRSLHRLKGICARECPIEFSITRNPSVRTDESHLLILIY